MYRLAAVQDVFFVRARYSPVKEEDGDLVNEFDLGTKMRLSGSS